MILGHLLGVTYTRMHAKERRRRRKPKAKWNPDSQLSKSNTSSNSDRAICVETITFLCWESLLCVLQYSSVFTYHVHAEQYSSCLIMQVRTLHAQIAQENQHPVFDYAGSHSAKCNLGEGNVFQLVVNAVSPSAKRNLREGNTFPCVC